MDKVMPGSNARRPHSSKRVLNVSNDNKQARVYNVSRVCIFRDRPH